MSSLHPLDWEILNATADDGENLEQVYLAVCFEFLPDAGEARCGASRTPFRWARSPTGCAASWTGAF